MTTDNLIFIRIRALLITPFLVAFWLFMVIVEIAQKLINK